MRFTVNLGYARWFCMRASDGQLTASAAQLIHQVSPRHWDLRGVMMLHLLHCSSNTPKPAPRGAHFEPPDAPETFFNATRGNHWARARAPPDFGILKACQLKWSLSFLIPICILQGFWTSLFCSLFHCWKTFWKRIKMGQNFPLSCKSVLCYFKKWLHCAEN